MQIGIFVTILLKKRKNKVWHELCNVLSVMSITIVTTR